LSEGQTLTQIAEALFVSAKTVSTDKARILEKLQIPHDVALIRYAVRHEFFDHNDRCIADSYARRCRTLSCR
jgi:DNA-binding NarL/FixJ family response regulator